MSASALLVRLLLLTLLSTRYAFATIIPLGNKSIAENWDIFKAQFRKQYSSTDEERRRKEIWKASLAFIEEHNTLHQRGLETYRIDGINEFADIDFEEFRSNVLMPEMTEDDYEKMLRPSSQSWRYMTPFVILPRDIPANFDWRSYYQTVGLVKHQGNCASSYAFAAISALERYHRDESGLIIQLSEQEIVDCSLVQSNRGCKGGTVYWAYDYMELNNGYVLRASVYPYSGNGKSTCPTNRVSLRKGDDMLVKGYHVTANSDEDAIKRVVAMTGPVAISFYATKSFQLFSGETIYDERDCPNNRTNHAMAIIGYGTSQDGIDYWIVKNSWGENWGDRGFAKIRRGNFTCAIGRFGGAFPEPYYPVTATTPALVLKTTTLVAPVKSAGRRATIAITFLIITQTVLFLLNSSFSN